MTHMRRCCTTVTMVLLALISAHVTGSPLQEPDVARGIPTADGLPAVFTSGQTVTVAVPSELTATPVRWEVSDDRQIVIRAGAMDGDTTTVSLGRLGIGWYRVEFLSESDECTGWTTAAVLAPLAAPIPQDSPVCIDSATAWFAKDDPAGQEAFARLAALTGANWIRDRMHWREMEPEPGQFTDTVTTYDTAADLQLKHGLKILQVFHGTPRWAVEEGESGGRYPVDLRHAYRFCKAMAQRYHGRVHAWEPWNEGNVATFGGHTADEMCTYQKAAYLGFKAGDPEIIVGWNVSTAKPTKLHTDLVLGNETWSYYDTYNIHTYDWPDSYARLRGPVYEAACGRPIWITESDRGLRCVTPEPWCELSREGEIQKAEFMAQSYATSFFAGAERHFHFVLGNYYEGNNGVQFGLLREDRTPRPTYVALAALGRFLAGAECLGRWALPDEPHAQIYAFRAEPDGQAHDVLVAWAEKPGDWNQRGKTVVDWDLPEGMRSEAVYDYLGRPLGSQVPAQLRSKPVFVLLKAGTADALPLEQTPRSDFRPSEPCPIVLQLHMPRSTSVNVEQIPWASDYEHQVEPETPTDLTLYAYNFSDTSRTGTVAIDHAPAGWQLTPRTWDVTLAPMERRALPCRLVMPKQDSDKKADHWVRLRGDFGSASRPVLVFRLIAHPGDGYESEVP